MRRSDLKQLAQCKTRSDMRCKKKPRQTLVTSKIRLGISLVLLLLQCALQSSSSAIPATQPYSALCVIAKDENRYIEEWVQYHRCLGIGKIYLYDHNSQIPMVNNIKSFVDEGFVEHIMFDGSHTRWEKEVFADNLTKFSATIQGKAYQDCLARFSSNHTFIGFIDIDEFIVFQDPSIRNINSLLKRYEDYGGVSFYWILFGSGGHKMSPQDWVTRSYFKCLPRGRHQNTQFKSFVNTAFKPTMYSPHRAMFNLSSSNSHLVDENRKPIAAGRNKNSTHSLVAIHHYATKSQQDFNIKRTRGGGAGVTRPGHFLSRLDKSCTDTCFGAALLYARLCGAS